MPHPETIDATDAALLRALDHDPRATVLALANALGLSRNTVQARLAKLERNGTLLAFEHRISPAALGYPIRAFIATQVQQQLLTEVAAALAEIPEVLEVLGVTGRTDLQIQVSAPDADDLYRIAAKILAIPGVDRTETSLIMRELVPYRLTPLLRMIQRN